MKTNDNKFSSNINLWLDIKADIELKIIAGDYEVGEKLTISNISEVYSIGKTTAQKVLEALCTENIIINRKGIGYFVKPFVKEILSTAHLVELKARINNIVKYGLRIGMDKSTLIDILSNAYDNLN